LIVESGFPGGSIIQAKYTHQQNRKLFTIIPDPESHSSQELNTVGAEYIIKNFSAIPIRNMAEVSSLLLNSEEPSSSNNAQKELF
jgi:predicted Rossmann fold nucleotide-binding protein DprA/Smf involved in DNA uptake